MSESKASRTLLKSPPELWSEVSSGPSLERHLDQFGEIRITKLEPETAVAWEGEHARGTITLESTGWGTKVCLTSQSLQAAPPLPSSVSMPFEAVEAEMRELNAFLERNRHEVQRQKGRWRRRLPATLRRWLGSPSHEGDARQEKTAPAQEVAPVRATAIEPGQREEAKAQREEASTAALNAALDSLGQAHHRPFSRA
jgi:hypothetical protein